MKTHTIKDIRENILEMAAGDLIYSVEKLETIIGKINEINEEMARKGAGLSQEELQQLFTQLLGEVKDEVKAVSMGVSNEIVKLTEVLDKNTAKQESLTQHTALILKRQAHIDKRLQILLGEGEEGEQSENETYESETQTRGSAMVYAGAGLVIGLVLGFLGNPLLMGLIG